MKEKNLVLAEPEKDQSKIKKMVLIFVVRIFRGLKSAFSFVYRKASELVDNVVPR